jgi:hypothetical protein
VDGDDRFVSLFIRGTIADIVEDISNAQDMRANGLDENQQGKVAVCFEIDPLVLGSLRVSSEFPIRPRMAELVGLALGTLSSGNRALIKLT